MRGGDGDAPGCTDDARSLAYLHESTVSSDGRALTATLTLVVDPYSPDGEAWYRAAARACRRARARQRRVARAPRARASNSIDAKDAVYAKFPLVVGGTLATVFALMGLSFRSLVAPLRSVATLVLTSSFVFGLCVLTYQRGGVGDDAQALSPSGACSRTSAARARRCARSAARPTAASCAGSRPSCASRSSSGSGSTTTSSSSRASTSSGSRGYVDHAAALKGIYKTGYIITAAGLIMTVAFGGLFASTELLLNQAAFLLVVSVLFDTFVVRTLLVPALFALSGARGWWRAAAEAARARTATRWARPCCAT